MHRANRHPYSSCPQPHLVIQLFVKLSQLCLTFILLYVRQANTQYIRRGCRLVVDDVVEGLYLSIGLFLVKLLFHWHALSWGRFKSTNQI